MKDMTSVAQTMMSDEEKAEIEKQMNSGNPNITSTSTPSVAAAAAAAAPQPTSLGGSTLSAAATAPPVVSEVNVDGSSASKPSDSASGSHIVPSGSSAQVAPSVSSTTVDKEAEKREAARKKAEQREKLREHDKARRKAMEARVAMLTQKMIERIRPFVDAKDPGGKDDPESVAFAGRMKREVEDLKLESFGVEVGFFLHICALF